MCGSFGLMVDVRVSFGGVICFVGGSWSPVVAELSLGLATTEPPQAHVHGFHFLCNDGFVRNTQCCGVVRLYGRFWLRPSHFNKGVAQRDHFFGTDVETGKFGFCGRGGDKFDDLGDCEYWAIEGGHWYVFR